MDVIYFNIRLKPDDQRKLQELALITRRKRGDVVRILIDDAYKKAHIDDVSLQDAKALIPKEDVQDG